MPVHDWTRVDAGIFHAFHTLWIVKLMGGLNAGLLPKGYYAMAEQVPGRLQTDFLTLRPGRPRRLPDEDSLRRGVVIAEEPPGVSFIVRPDLAPGHRAARTWNRA